MVARFGPGFGQLDLMISLQHLACRIDNDCGVEKFVRRAMRRADHRVDTGLAARPGHPALGLGELFGGDLRDKVVVVAGQGALGENGDADTVFATPTKKLLNVGDILGQIAGGSHLDGGDAKRSRHFSRRGCLFSSSRRRLQLLRLHYTGAEQQSRKEDQPKKAPAHSAEWRQNNHERILTYGFASIFYEG